MGKPQIHHNTRSVQVRYAESFYGSLFSEGLSLLQFLLTKLCFVFVPEVAKPVTGVKPLRKT